MINACKLSLGLVSAFALARGAWVAPQSGWFYVTDLDRNLNQSTVLLLDNTGIVKGALPFGYEAVIALSPDARKLYAVSGAVNETVLDVVDAVSGKILHSSNVSDRVLYMVRAGDGLVTVSPKGDRVYVLSMTTDGRDQYSVSVFDGNGIQLQSLPLYSCGVGDIIALDHAPWDVAVLCPASNLVAYFSLDATGHITQNKTAALPSVPGGEDVGFRTVRFVVLKDNGDVVMAMSKRGTIYTAGSESGWSLAPSTSDGCMVFDVGRAKNTTTIVVPKQCSLEQSLAQRIDVYLSDGSIVNSITTSSFWAGVLFDSGAKFGMVNPDDRSLKILDVKGGKINSVYPNIAKYPVQVVAIP
jgi:hypothetical protein